VGEGGAEVGAVGIRGLLLGRVDVLAAGTVDLDPGDLEVLADGDGQHVLLVAHHAGTVAEPPRQVAFPHDGESLGGGDVAGVEEAVEFGGVLVDFEEAAWWGGYRGSSTSSSAGGMVRRIIL
jgi:hypothetical protein